MFSFRCCKSRKPIEKSRMCSFSEKDTYEDPPVRIARPLNPDISSKTGKSPNSELKGDDQLWKEGVQLHQLQKRYLSSGSKKNRSGTNHDSDQSTSKKNRYHNHHDTDGTITSPTCGIFTPRLSYFMIRANHYHWIKIQYNKEHQLEQILNFFRRRHAQLQAFIYTKSRRIRTRRRYFHFRVLSLDLPEHHILLQGFRQ